jgi:hypothetical protein
MYVFPAAVIGPPPIKPYPPLATIAFSNETISISGTGAALPKSSKFSKSTTFALAVLNKQNDNRINKKNTLLIISLLGSRVYKKGIWKLRWNLSFGYCGQSMWEVRSFRT